MKILVVDDEFNNRLLLQKILSPHGVCDLAVNGQEALDAFERAHAHGQPYDLICMDIMMPEMDGHQAAQEIRNREVALGEEAIKEVNLLMVTSLSSSQTIVDAFYKDGCTDFLVKPVTKAIVEKKLQEFGLLPQKP